MCGRFLMNEEAVNATVSITGHYEEIPLDLHFGTIYPSMEALAVDEKDGRLHASVLRFGIQSESMKKRIINARAETADSKFMFRQAWRHSRCAIPANAFYEWTPSKDMITFTEPGDSVMFLAALKIDDDFVILTREADASVAPYYHRMPVILEKQQVGEWILDPHASARIVENAVPVLDAYEPPKQLSLF